METEFEVTSNGTTPFDINGRNVYLRLCEGYYDKIPLRIATAEETITFLHAEYFGNFTRKFGDFVSHIPGCIYFPSEKKVVLGTDSINSHEGVYLIDACQSKFTKTLDDVWPNNCSREIYSLLEKELSEGSTQEGIRFNADRSIRFVPREIKQKTHGMDMAEIYKSAFYLALFGEEGRQKLSEFGLLGDHSIDLRDISGSGAYESTRETFDQVGHFRLESYPVSDEELATFGGPSNAFYIDNCNTRGITRRALTCMPIRVPLNYIGVFEK